MIGSDSNGVITTILYKTVNRVFCQQGKWSLPGARFDASTSDFVVILYQGKLNTLT
jgi:hypothetical protein